MQLSLHRPLPAHAYFAGSAVFHYLGPAFAVLLFARVDVLGVAWLRIASAAAGVRRLEAPLALARRASPWRWAWCSRGMNGCFYEAIARLPLGTVGGDRVPRRDPAAARSAQAAQRAPRLRWRWAASYVLTDVRIAASRSGWRSRSPTRRCSRSTSCSPTGGPADPGVEGLAAAMLVAVVAVTPIAGWAAVPALRRPGGARRRRRRGHLLVGDPVRVRPAGDGATAARQLRAAVSLLPATAALIGLVVLGQLPTAAEALGVGLVVLGVAAHEGAA